MPVSVEDMLMVRHVVQKILVPSIFIVGLIGNSVSIYVLTRRRMRCTTNLYLTALAITDLMYLTMALLLSLQHYQYTKLHWPSYWSCFGVILWLCDACAYISIYIAVSFTIERFIAIRYPLRRQTFCTETLAKNVIAGVSVFCLLSTLSTAFEHRRKINYRFVDAQGNPCNGSLIQGMEQLLQDRHQQQQQDLEQLLYREQRPPEGEGRGELEPTEFIGFMDKHLKGSPATFQFKATVLRTMAEGTRKDVELNNIALGMSEATCQNVTYYAYEASALGNNKIYLELWYFFTLFVFVLLPLCVLLTFNLFLILLVRRSKTLRSEMTNADSVRRACKGKISMGGGPMVSQENRITITLIAVVLLFIICQLPWAIYLIISNQMEIDHNLRIIIGNIFNFMTALNAAGNFFLYCVLSDKYRRTIRELLTGRHRRPKRHTSVSAYTSNSSRRSVRASTPSPTAGLKR